MPLDEVCVTAWRTNTEFAKPWIGEAVLPSVECVYAFWTEASRKPSLDVGRVL